MTFSWQNIAVECPMYSKGEDIYENALQ